MDTVKGMDPSESFSEYDALEEAIVLTLILRKKRRKKRRTRKMWVRPIFRRRRQQGEYHHLLQEMRLSDADSHFSYMRMSRETFDVLLGKVRSNCKKLF